MTKYGSKKWLKEHRKELMIIYDFIELGDKPTIIAEDGVTVTFAELGLRNLNAQIVQMWEEL